MKKIDPAPVIELYDVRAETTPVSLDHLFTGCRQAIQSGDTDRALGLLEAISLRMGEEK